MKASFDPAEIDTSRPHPARMYNAFLGGKDNYPVDRAAVLQILRQWPEVRLIAQANRAFLQRAVRFMAAEAGIRQFIDIGTGIPSAGNVHEVAGEVAPGARVVYVDNDRCKSGCAHADAGATETASRPLTCGVCASDANWKSKRCHLIEPRQDDTESIMNKIARNGVVKGKANTAALTLDKI